MSTQGAPRKRLLFVDDDAGIRETMPSILQMHGFEVTTVATVTEALREITNHRFDVLISDLNIGHPGDGFMVVHVMRRHHPECVTLILTGYPAFESALQAIRSQVDEYLVKPAAPTDLIRAIEEKLSIERRASVFSGRERVASILRDHHAEIAQRTLEKMKSEPPLDALPLSDEERIGPIQPIVHELAQLLESPHDPDHSSEAGLEASQHRGWLRQEQGYTVPMLIDSMRLLERAIFEFVYHHMLALNLSFLVMDLARLNDCLALQLKVSVIAFLDAERKPARPRS